MLSIKALKYLAKTKIFRDDEIKSFFEEEYFLDKKMSEFSNIILTAFPDLSIPREVLILIVQYEDDNYQLHYNYKCNISPKLLSKCYSPTSLLLFKFLRITSNVMLLLSFAWYLKTWHNKQSKLYRSIRDKFVAGNGIKNIKPVPSNFDTANMNLPFSEKLKRAYNVNPFKVTTPTIPLSKYLILPFPPTPNTIDIKWKYWNNKYNLLGFIIIWYFYEVLYNYIIDRSYNDFSQITKYLNPKYSNTKYEQITTHSIEQSETTMNNKMNNTMNNTINICNEDENIEPKQEMSGTLKALYWKWRCIFHNNHHERFVNSNSASTVTFNLKRSHYFLTGNCLVAVALLHNAIMPYSQLIGYIFKNFDIYNGRYFFLNGNEKWTKRIAYYSQSIAIYSFKFSSIFASCCFAGIIWYIYPWYLDLAGPYYHHQPPAKMICRNQIRHRYKNMYIKLMLLLSCMPYANNFTTLFAVFCYGLFLGEHIEHLIDSETQFRVYQNYRNTKLAQTQLTTEEIGKMQGIINKQYDHKPIARLLPLLFHITSIILIYSLIGTPERLQIQAVRAYKSRKLLARFGISFFILGLIGHLGNATYLQSGYYYNFPKSYSFNDYKKDIKEQRIEYHPPPRDLFECFSVGMIKYEGLVWRIYRVLGVVSDSVYKSIQTFTTRFDPS